MSTPEPRTSHADLNIRRRQAKARKIANLLQRHRPLRGASVLEIGTGSGAIAAAFVEEVGPTGSVTAVDVADERQVTEGFRFISVTGAGLPFQPNSFDVVISNHVMEHVGARPVQLLHLREIARVLRCDGVGYLAVPNRWALLEPHFRLWLLSWLPKRCRSAYVRLMRRGTHYDCEPPGPWAVRKLMSDAG